MASNNAVRASRKSLAMGPSVRNLLSHYQLDPSRIASTGPHQTLLKGDVMSYISHNQLQPKSGNQQQTHNTTDSKKAGAYVPNLDITGYTPPKTGPEGFSKIAKKLLDV